MKNIFILLIVILAFAIRSQAQLIANAGADVNVCMTSSSSFDTTTIGGNPSATGGVSPYQYSWYITPYQILSLPYVYTSHLLLDSTVSNPKIYSSVYHTNDSLMVYLEVTDNIGSKAYDSVKVFFTGFVHHLAGEFHTIISGDSVFSSLGSSAGGFAPHQWLWKPNHGLIDSNLSTAGWLKPMQNTSYYCITTDRFGCSDTSSPFIHITVLPVRIEDLTSQQIVEAFPNPVKDNLLLKTAGNFEINGWEIYSITGKLMSRSKSTLELNIDFSEIDRGIYNVVIRTNKGIIKKKVLKQ